MITPKQFSNGQCIIMDGQMYVVLFTQHKRTAQRKAEVYTKLRNVKTGNTLEVNLTPDDLFEEAYIDKKNMMFSYHDGDVYHFTDPNTYEQLEINKSIIGDSVVFLKDNTEVIVEFYEGNPIGVELPVHVALKVTYTEPGLKGDTARGGTKPATLETGAVVKVPLFIEQDEMISIDTRTGEYEGRVK